MKRILATMLYYTFVSMVYLFNKAFRHFNSTIEFTINSIDKK